MRRLIFIESIIFVRNITKFTRPYLFKRWIRIRWMKSAKVSINLNVAKFVLRKSLRA